MGMLPFNWFSGHFTSGIDNIKTGMGWNTANGKPSNQYKLEHREAFQYSRYDDSIGSWVGNATSDQLKKIQNPKMPIRCCATCMKKAVLMDRL